jgi:signal transduction histidine kinase
MTSPVETSESDLHADPAVPGATHQGASPAGPSWRVLVVDDDDDVHVATELAMLDVTIEGRALHFLQARSAREALQLVAADDDIAAILLDVVMETPDAGLRLVRQIRQDLGRSEVRIILRTGQPGYAPEMETVRSLEINDYRTKADMTRVRLFTTLTAAIRSYAQLRELARQRNHLSHTNAALEAAREAERTEYAARLAAESALRLARETVDQCVAQRTRELSQAVSELNAFNRMVSHDLQGPLHGMAGLTGLIRSELDHGDQAKVRSWLAMLETQARNLAELVTELLQLARVSQERMQRAPVSLAALVDDALQTLALSCPGQQAPAVIMAALPVVSVDAALMRQVFVNLLSNAVKFTRDAGSPCIEVSCLRQGSAWRVTVRDNGVGFDARRAADLFKPFTRLHATRFEGSGIGLTIVERIVARHGGHVWAEGQPGHGAFFHFLLPDDPTTRA